MRKHYSGPLSKEFWRRVNVLKNPEAASTMYHAGVLLQNMEERVIHWLDNYEQAGRKTRR